MLAPKLVCPLLMLGLAAGCELFIDVGDGNDRPPDGPTRPDVDAGTDGSTAPACFSDSSYIDIGVSGSFYRVLGRNSAESAIAECASDGTSLVSINTALEFSEVTALVAALPVNPLCPGNPCAWTGLAQVNAPTPELGWQWPDGTNGQINWATDEPNDNDGTEDLEEDCGLLDASGIQDRDCVLETFAICECNRN